MSECMALSGLHFVDEINQLLPVPHICIRGLELFGARNHILAIRHPAIHNHERCIWQLGEVTSSLFARALAQIRRWSPVASPSFFAHLPNLACTYLLKHLHPLMANPLSIIEIIQRQPDLEYLQKICNRRLPVQGSISNLFQAVLPPDYGSMILPQEPSHSYLLPLVERTAVGLPNPFGKLLQGEFGLLQADWRVAVGTAQVRRIVALTICIILVV